MTISEATHAVNVLSRNVLGLVGSENGCSFTYDVNQISRELAILQTQDEAGRADIERRFWQKVNITDGCWLWTASVTGSRKVRHGQFVIRNASKKDHFYAHRVAWALTGRNCPPGLNLCHTCDTPRCVRVDHLFVGTQADNLDDARAKGRLIDGLGARKLSDDAYRDILSTPRTDKSVLAAKYGVSEVSINRIRNGSQGSTFHRSEHQPPSIRVNVIGPDSEHTAEAC